MSLHLLIIRAHEFALFNLFSRKVENDLSNLIRSSYILFIYLFIFLICLFCCFAILRQDKRKEKMKITRREQILLRYCQFLNHFIFVRPI